MLEIASRPEALDADWLTRALREAGALPEGRVREVSWKMVGTGKIGDNVRYQLAYEGAPESAPRSVVAKLPAADPTPRASAAVGGFYWREVHFYRELAPRVAMRTPQVYVALLHENRTDYVILMEDMAPAEPGDQIEGCGPEVAEMALVEAAKLHASLWASPELGDFEWLTQPSPEGAKLGKALLDQMWPGFVERFGAPLSREALELGERFVRCFERWSLSFGPPRSVVHADYRLENMLFGGDSEAPPVTVVDWQSCMHNVALIDAAYFLGGGLVIEDRRRHERELLEAYRGELSRRGVALSEGDCWREYRRATLHGVLITVLGAMMSEVDPRGDRMFAAMIERHLQHALDLDGDEFLA